MRKLYFYDSGLCSFLQGNNDENQTWKSPLLGSLFETMVFSELAKTRSNFIKNWKLFTWRTKEKDEIDFVLSTEKTFCFIEAKVAIHGAGSFDLDPLAKNIFKTPHNKIVVTSTGEINNLSKDTVQVPINKLGTYLASTKNG